MLKNQIFSGIFEYCLGRLPTMAKPKNFEPMKNIIKVFCENTSSHIQVEMGTTLAEICDSLALPNAYPILAAYVNNRIKELNYKVYTPISIRFIDITQFEGYRVYQRTISFMLQRAVEVLYPGKGPDNLDGRDPVDLALEFTGERRDDARARACWGAHLRRLGALRFCEALHVFTVDAQTGRIKNRAAALNTHLAAL